jgi:subtilisin family serine protease
MSRRSGLLLAAMLCAAAVAAVSASAAVAATAPYVVAYGTATADPDAATTGLEQRGGFKSKFRYKAAVEGFAATLSDAQLKVVQSSPDVAYIESDTTFQAVGLAPLVTGETLPPGIRRIGAATATSAHTSANSSVAVLDTGVDLPNSDLNAVSGTNCVSPGTTAQDNNGHGTNVAGVVAARNSGTGVTGVAPGTRIVSVKVLDSKGSGTLSQILCGIDWVTANAAAWNITVANMSVAGTGANDSNCGKTNKDAEHQAICRSTAAGVTYVAAAGNSKTDFAKTIPASYPEVLTVTAMTDANGTPGGGAAVKCKPGESDDTYASFSNFAVGTVATAHTVAAPGTCVVSDAIGGGTSTYYGTSQAAPHVAGTVALCLGNGGVTGPCSGLTPAQVIDKVRTDAAGFATAANGYQGDPLHPVSGKYFGNLAYAGGY